MCNLLLCNDDLNDASAAGVSLLSRSTRRRERHFEIIDFWTAMDQFVAHFQSDCLSEHIARLLPETSNLLPSRPVLVQFCLFVCVYGFSTPFILCRSDEPYLHDGVTLFQKRGVCVLWFFHSIWRTGGEQRLRLMTVITHLSPTPGRDQWSSYTSHLREGGKVGKKRGKEVEGSEEHKVKCAENEVERRNETEEWEREAEGRRWWKGWKWKERRG